MPLLAPLLLGLCPQAAPTSPAPDEDPVLATWEGGELRASVFDRWLGRVTRRQAAGVEGIEHLLQIQLVDREAESRGLRIPDAAVAERLERVRVEARSNGFDLEQVLRSRGLDLEEFTALLRSSLRHEALARQDLEIPEGQPVSAEDQRRWSRERLAELMQEAESPPPGLAFEHGPYRITEEELGRLLRSMLPPGRLLARVEDRVLEELVPERARALGLTWDDRVAAAELAWRDRETRARMGMSYEQLLALQQARIEDVIQGEQFRTACLLRQLAALRWDDTWFDALSPEERRDLEERYGESRQVLWILLRSVDEKTDPLDLSHEEAAEELRRWKEEAVSTEAFAELAARYSEDERSRRARGSLGWIHRRGEDQDPALAAAAFALEEGATSDPVRVREGMALIHVAALRRPASEEEFREEVRRARHRELRRLLLEEAGFHCIYQDLLAGGRSGG